MPTCAWLNIAYLLLDDYLECSILLRLPLLCSTNVLLLPQHFLSSSSQRLKIKRQAVLVKNRYVDDVFLLVNKFTKNNNGMALKMKK